MSITVSKLCANAQANYVMKLVAGKEGMGNYVRWVHLVENVDVSPFLQLRPRNSALSSLRTAQRQAACLSTREQ